MKEHLSKLPSLNSVLEALKSEQEKIHVGYIKRIITDILDLIKESPHKFALDTKNRKQIEDLIITETRNQICSLLEPSLRQVVNATGVVLHTGLGRAPIGVDDLTEIQKLAHYTNLEINLDSGKRGERLDHVTPHLHMITGAEDGVVVNNNAAAVLLALHSIARKKEVIVSRGELVEIGGSFRMPEVMQNSQAKMVEIGATNKTHLTDYKSAISSKTAAILLVHPSNYQIIGFAQKPEIHEIVELAHLHQIPVIYDLGSGAVTEMKNYGLGQEPEVSKIVTSGVDIITFSADKLLGGPQAGIIVGNTEYVKRIRKNHMLRALRCDKITLALLNKTLRKYLQPTSLKQTNTTLALFSRSIKMMRDIGHQILDGIDSKPLVVRIVDAEGKVGSGAFPVFKIPALALEVDLPGWSTNKIAQYMRSLDVPIIGIIDKDHYLLNLLTVFEHDIPTISAALNRLT
jgi:L-seryl-tRNA(Ser) seleniumtransferase